jgi:hypothetical protein
MQPNYTFCAHCTQYIPYVRVPLYQRVDNFSVIYSYVPFCRHTFFCCFLGVKNLRILSSLFEKLRDARDKTLVCKNRKPKKKNSIRPLFWVILVQTSPPPPPPVKCKVAFATYIFKLDQEDKQMLFRSKAGRNRHTGAYRSTCYVGINCRLEDKSGLVGLWLLNSSLYV